MGGISKRHGTIRLPDILAARLRLRLNHDGMGALFGVPGRTWRKWEDGERNMPPPAERLVWLLQSPVGASVRKLLERVSTTTKYRFVKSSAE